MKKEERPPPKKVPQAFLPGVAVLRELRQLSSREGKVTHFL